MPLTNVLPRSGSLLLAQPWLREPVFARGVILLLDTESENEGKGSMGLVLNHPSPITLQHIIPTISYDGHIPVFIGGPVELERLFLLHKLPEFFPGSVEVRQGIYLGASVEEIQNYISEYGVDHEKMRFFIGYSGWDNGQLLKEIGELTWAVGVNVNTDTLLNDYGVPYWRREVSRLGEEYRHWLMVPENAQMN